MLRVTVTWTQAKAASHPALQPRCNPVPAGTAPELARGDYVSALYGLDGELLTDDYPKDHPHHRE